MALVTELGAILGIYTLLGKRFKDSKLATARSFVFTTPVLIFLLLIYPLELSQKGMFLAIASGAIASGLGYMLWYTVLKDLVTSTAAIIQLSVPMLAALGGVLFLGEAISIRLLIASGLILGGIYLKVK